MIFVGSRYERSDVTFSLDSRTGVTRPTVMRQVPSNLNFARPSNVVVWRDGDRIDALSQRILGSSDRWWAIMDANPDVLDPMSLRSGASVVLP